MYAFKFASMGNEASLEEFLTRGLVLFASHSVAADLSFSDCNLEHLSLTPHREKRECRYQT